MHKKTVCDFLIVTFLIDALCWGLCAVLSQSLHLALDDHFGLGFLFFLGGMSPTIGSYVSWKRNGQISGVRDWLKRIFDLKHNMRIYILVIIFVAIYYVVGCLVSGFQIGTPIFMLFILTPMMLLGGGNEEVGWRMVLQPELEQKFGFFGASLMVGIIWWLWHAPLFWINGTANANINYLFFGVMCIDLSFALAAVRKVSNGVFPCVLLHCLVNACSSVFLFNYSVKSSILTTAVMIPVSLLAVRRAEEVK